MVIHQEMQKGVECPIELLASPPAAGWKIETLQHMHGSKDEALRIATQIIAFQEPVRESREIFGVR